jgi:hypothetical protein
MTFVMKGYRVISIVIVFEFAGGGGPSISKLTQLAERPNFFSTLKS